MRFLMVMAQEYDASSPGKRKLLVQIDKRASVAQEQVVPACEPPPGLRNRQLFVKRRIARRRSIRQKKR